MNSFKIINTDKFPEKWKTNKNLQWFLHNYPEEELITHPEDEFIHPFLAVEFAKQFHLEEIEERDELLKKARVWIKGTYGRVDLKPSQYEALGKWLKQYEELK